MKLQMSFIALLFLLVGSASFAQTLAPPFRINKSPVQMQTESEQSKAFYNRISESEPPRKLDLLKTQTPIKDQGHRGSCVAFASVALTESMYKLKTGKNVDLSEQFAYWDSKAVRHISPRSEGSFPLPFLKAIEADGIPAEQTWPYEGTPWYNDEAGHKDCFEANKTHPNNMPTACLTNGQATQGSIAAPKMKIAKPHQIASAPEAIMAFMQRGIPVEVGADVYDQAWSYKLKTSPGYLTGTVVMPPTGDTLIGGHAFLLVGYDMDRQVFLFKNSWGTDRWASQSPARGYGTIPFEYIRKYAEAYVADMP